MALGTVPNVRGRALRGSASRLSSVTCTRSPRAPVFSGAVCSDSSNAIPSSPKESSSDSRAPRSGAANTQAKRFDVSSRTREMKRVSEPAIAGCSILSSDVTAPPARMIETKFSRCCPPKSSSCGRRYSPSRCATPASPARRSISSYARVQSSNSDRGSRKHHERACAHMRKRALGALVHERQVAIELRRHHACVGKLKLRR